jgi:hypothetical protein
MVKRSFSRFRPNQKGKEETGPWATVGTLFSLKDGDETRELAKFVIGEKCD